MHIVCAVVWVGGAVSIHMLGRMYAKAGDTAAMLDFNRRAISIGNRIFAPASIVLIIAGVLLVEEVGYDYDALWIALGFVGWLFSFAVGIGFYAREQRKVDEAVKAEGPATAVVGTSMRRVLAANSVEILILLLVVVDMSVKPG